MADMTLLEIQARLIANCGERFSSSVIWSAHAEEQLRSDVLMRRRDWFAAQLDLDPRKLVFIDETGTSTNLARKGGRCRRGRRLRVGIPRGHHKDDHARRRPAPFWPGGAEDVRPADERRHVRAMGRKMSRPHTLKGDIVVMDNLSSHKGPRVEQLTKAAGAELRYLPP